LARTDHEVVVTGEDHDDGVSPFEAVKRCVRGVQGLHALLQMVGCQVDDDFGVSVAFETELRGFQLSFQGGVIFDDAVMNDGDVFVGVWVGVAFGGQTMCGPARVANSNCAVEGRGFVFVVEVDDFPFGAAALDVTVIERRYTRGVVTAIFEAFEAFDQKGGSVLFAEYSNYSAHFLFAFMFFFIGVPDFIHHKSTSAGKV